VYHLVVRARQSERRRSPCRGVWAGSSWLVVAGSSRPVVVWCNSRWFVCDNTICESVTTPALSSMADSTDAATVSAAIAAATANAAGSAATLGSTSTAVGLPLNMNLTLVHVALLLLKTMLACGGASAAWDRMAIVTSPPLKTAPTTRSGSASLSRPSLSPQGPSGVPAALADAARQDQASLFWRDRMWCLAYCAMNVLDMVKTYATGGTSSEHLHHVATAWGYALDTAFGSPRTMALARMSLLGEVRAKATATLKPVGSECLPECTNSSQSREAVNRDLCPHLLISTTPLNGSGGGDRSWPRSTNCTFCSRLTT
jgi:hypothetical protein